MSKKEIRKKFKEDTFDRDGYKCAWCGMPNVDDNMDAHHITDRSEMPNGGYVKENGISLCKDGRVIDYVKEESCHMKAERFHISEGKEWVDGMHPNDLYKLIGSSKELAIKMSEKL